MVFLFTLYFTTNKDKAVTCKDITSELKQVVETLSLGKHGTRECSSERNIVPNLMGLPSSKRDLSQNV